MRERREEVCVCVSVCVCVCEVPKTMTMMMMIREERRSEEDGDGCEVGCVLSKNKNPTLRMWGTRTPHLGCGEGGGGGDVGGWVRTV